MDFRSPAASCIIMRSKVVGDTNERFVITADGSIFQGSGSAVPTNPLSTSWVTFAAADYLQAEPYPSLAAVGSTPGLPQYMVQGGQVHLRGYIILKATYTTSAGALLFPSAGRPAAGVGYALRVPTYNVGETSVDAVADVSSVGRLRFHEVGGSGVALQSRWILLDGIHFPMTDYDYTWPG
jgi:hypothetical protein